ncbi:MULTISPECIES: hypothetical protein [Azospirillum]|uniref:Uncharacterized protein n=1 Tax=Azospirillum himalayense TaxID=654847 RepID=A0ABW0G5T3_9PROT|nr:hypothetical protein [Azospirillum baldaniorum]TWA70731.1 hypothetical protein FBZ84_102281 [Azospirillum baldaniorum]
MTPRTAEILSAALANGTAGILRGDTLTVRMPTANAVQIAASNANAAPMAFVFAGLAAQAANTNTPANRAG